MNLHVSDFNLRHTLECGQAFRWKREEKGYVGVVKGSLWKVSQEEETLSVESDPLVSEAEVVRYFSLSSDLRETLSPLRKDPILESPLNEFWGLRILDQDPWECLISYIFSIFNNVKRISLLVESLSERFGKKVGSNKVLRYTFPSAKTLAFLTKDQLQSIHPGFRDRYLLETAKIIAQKRWDWEALRKMETAEAKKCLLTLPGVGEKVADCILLFSLGKTDAFPIDLWIERSLRKLYFHGRRKTLRKMQRFAHQRFGKAAGYAQEYLYAYARRYL